MLVFYLSRAYFCYLQESWHFRDANFNDNLIFVIELLAFRARWQFFSLTQLFCLERSRNKSNILDYLLLRGSYEYGLFRRREEKLKRCAFAYVFVRSVDCVVTTALL
jgi:hypothetical protein